jgi:transposase
MEGGTTIVGIDVGKTTCTATWIASDPAQRNPVCTFTNALDGVAKLEDWLDHQGIHPASTTVCIENTGPYSLLLACTLYGRGWMVVQVSPGEVHNSRLVAQTKTDAFDCWVIATYAFRYPDRLDPFLPPHPAAVAIGALMQQREQFVHTKRALNNQRHALLLVPDLPPQLLEPLEAMIEHCDDGISDCERRIRERINADDQVRALALLLESIPGVGPILTAALIVVFDAGRRPIDVRRLAAWIGIAPLERQSGAMHKPARCRGYGPPLLRRLLFLPAMGLIREGQLFHSYYLRKQREGKAKPLIINNVANKLLRIICAVVRDQQPYYATFRSAPPKAA